MCKKRNFYIDKLQETNHTRTHTHTQKGGGEKENRMTSLRKELVCSIDFKN